MTNEMTAAPELTPLAIEELESYLSEAFHNDDDPTISVDGLAALLAAARRANELEAEVADLKRMFWALDEEWLSGGCTSGPDESHAETWTWLRWGEHIPLPVTNGFPVMTDALRDHIDAAEGSPYYTAAHAAAFAKEPPQ